MTPDEATRGQVEEIRRRQRPWRMDDIETLLDRITALEAQRDEKYAALLATARWLRDEVDNNHVHRPRVPALCSVCTLLASPDVQALGEE